MRITTRCTCPIGSIVCLHAIETLGTKLGCNDIKIHVTRPYTCYSFPFSCFQMSDLKPSRAFSQTLSITASATSTLLLSGADYLHAWADGKCSFLVLHSTLLCCGWKKWHFSTRRQIVWHICPRQLQNWQQRYVPLKRKIHLSLPYIHWSITGIQYLRFYSGGVTTVFLVFESSEGGWEVLGSPLNLSLLSVLLQRQCRWDKVLLWEDCNARCSPKGPEYKI